MRYIESQGVMVAIASGVPYHVNQLDKMARNGPNQTADMPSNSCAEQDGIRHASTGYTESVEYYKTCRELHVCHTLSQQQHQANWERTRELGLHFILQILPTGLMPRLECRTIGLVLLPCSPLAFLATVGSEMAASAGVQLVFGLAAPAALALTKQCMAWILVQQGLQVTIAETQASGCWCCCEGDQVQPNQRG